MKTIPSIDFWRYSEFVTARRLQYEATKNMKPDWVSDKMEYIVMEPPEEVICDKCNCDIPEIDPSTNFEAMINLVEFGNRVVCDKCYQEYYARQTVKYRKLNDDGTIGEIVGEEK